MIFRQLMNTLPELDKDNPKNKKKIKLKTPKIMHFLI